jgi:hypothetical protein
MLHYTTTYTKGAVIVGCYSSIYLHRNGMSHIKILIFSLPINLFRQGLGRSFKYGTAASFQILSYPTFMIIFRLV